MAKAPVSAKFQKFAEKTTRGEFDKARKQESMAGGCPLPIGTRGVAVVGEIECRETKLKADGTGGDPLMMIRLEVETPEDYRGKTLSGAGLMFVIKDGKNSTKEDAWARALDALEGMGLPRKIRTDYEDFVGEVIGWFDEQPRRVDYTVSEDTWEGNQSGKTVRAFAHVEEASIETAETPTKEVEADPNADYCTYLGKKHKILSFDKENDTYELEQDGSGRIRPGVPADKVTLD